MRETLVVVNTSIELERAVPPSPPLLIGLATLKPPIVIGMLADGTPLNETSRALFMLTPLRNVRNSANFPSWT